MLGIRFHDDVQDHRSVYRFLYRDITYRREYEVSSVRKADRVVAVSVCAGSCHRAFKVDGSVGDRLSVGIINDRSGYIDFLCHCDRRSQ